MKEQKTKEMEKITIPNDETKLKFEAGNVVTGSYYDHQEVRIAAMNRIRNIIRRKLEGIGMIETEAKKEKEKTYEKKYTDKQLFDLLDKAVKSGKILSKEHEYIEKILNVEKKAEVFESECKLLMAEFVEDEPIYLEFLSKITGISSVLSSNCIRLFGYCEQAPHISSLWKFSGLAPGQRKIKGEKLNYNPKAKVLAWKIVHSFVMQNTPFYRAVYDKEKAKQLVLLESHEDEENHKSLASQSAVENRVIDASHHRDETHKPIATPPKSKLHAERRAYRKTAKIFLAHYWLCARELKGLEISAPYVIERMGHEHFVDWHEAVAMNEMAKLQGRNVEKDVMKAVKSKKPIMRKRAIVEMKPIAIKRASDEKKTRKQQRASKDKKPIEKKRANNIEKTENKKRAKIDKKTIRS